ncbi:MAG: hypothetical protein GY805_14250 [Chloroflexi bacterium]|nr:hypothetical protein [Chloroflexota bacterium]
MKLPNGNKGEVPEVKIVSYLLSLTHEDGRSKAIFFLRFGYSPSNWTTLATALKEHALQHPVASIEESPFGKRYIIEGSIKAPDGRTPLIRTIWFIEDETEIPRLITAYPLRRQT